MITRGLHVITPDLDSGTALKHFETPPGDTYSMLYVATCHEPASPALASDRSSRMDESRVGQRLWRIGWPVEREAGLE